MPGFLQYTRPFRVLLRPDHSPFARIPAGPREGPGVRVPRDDAGYAAYRDALERHSMTRAALHEMYPRSGAVPYQGSVLEDDLRRIVGAMSHTDPALRTPDDMIGRYLTDIPDPMAYDYMGSLGSLTPGGGRALLRDWRERNPDRGLVWYSLPRATPFYERIGARAIPESRNGSNFDFMLEPGQQVRRRGGAIRAAA